MIVGQIDSIKTTKDMCVRLVIDIDKDKCPADVITWQNEMVEISHLPDPIDYNNEEINHGNMG
jgi:hypothetical protein